MGKSVPGPAAEKDAAGWEFEFDNEIPESFGTCLKRVNLWGNHDYYC